MSKYGNVKVTIAALKFDSKRCEEGCMKKLEYTGNKQAAYDFLNALDISQKWVIMARQFKELLNSINPRSKVSTALPSL